MTYYLSIFELAFGIVCIIYVFYRNRHDIYPSKDKKSKDAPEKSSEATPPTHSGKHA